MQYLKLLLEMQPNDQMTDAELEKFAPWKDDVKNLIKERVAKELSIESGTH